MKNILYFLVMLVFLLTSYVYGQIAVNTTGNSPNASAAVDVDWSDKGLLIPRVALTQTTSASPITAPAPSLLVYNTATVNDVTPGYYYWSGTKWLAIPVPQNGPGASGQVLTSQGPGLPVQWTTSTLSSSACLPTQISNQMWSGVNWMTCGTYCANYTGTAAGDGGFTDWRMPTIEEYAYARQQFAAPTGGWRPNYFWTHTIYTPSIGDWVVFDESDGNWYSYYYTNAGNCRCVR